MDKNIIREEIHILVENLMDPLWTMLDINGRDNFFEPLEKANPNIPNLKEWVFEEIRKRLFS